ncbi:MAG: hypothetical protein EOM34_10645, partial [Clostridia bacterium]|nr:hypothetical protein [Clostridia bacterium]NCD03014.1 hypothetical protein [Clostridia bacterium]
VYIKQELEANSLAYQLNTYHRRSVFTDFSSHTLKNIYAEHPRIHYHFTSGDTALVAEKLDKGLYDFALIVEPPDLSRYNYIEIPESNLWGVVMQTSHPLSGQEHITVDDLIPYPIFTSQQAFSVDFPRWCGEKIDRLNLLASFNLSTNAAFFSKEGVGLTLSFDELINTNEKSGLTFRPLYPKLETKMYIIWKKYQVFTPAAELLLDEIKKATLPH